MKKNQPAGKNRAAGVNDIAAQTGFAVSTVTKVLRGDGDRYGIREATQRQIRELADKLGYRGSFFARALRSGNSGLVVLVTCTAEFPVRICTQNLVAQELCKRGLKVMTVDVTWELGLGRNMAEVLREVTALHPAAVLVGRIEGVAVDQWVGVMLRRGVPVVGMDYVNKLPIDQVYVSRRQVAYLQTSHLLELGHRRIRFTTGSGQDWLLSERLLGFQAALKEYKLRFTPELVTHLHSRVPDIFQVGYDAVRDSGWVASGVTGVTALNDQVALGMLHAFGEAGVAVPGRMSLVGSENQAAAAWYAVPLTTVDWNLKQQAELAVEWLVERMNGLSAKPRREAIQPRLVVRQSTAAPAG
ncbi:MAG: LacI family DNA-binding transcriptional regulator [Kiritimatiellae bacterium]|nr:LacI family DNA-binding transcriptional regulator [Kiritimatiellia bacterium]